jgi:hypothetical protein
MNFLRLTLKTAGNPTILLSTDRIISIYSSQYLDGSQWATYVTMQASGSAEDTCFTVRESTNDIELLLTKAGMKFHGITTP